MFTYFQFNLKGISLILLFLLPISLLTGPAIPDISITIIAILFLIHSFILKDFQWLKEKWIIAALTFWISLIFISFFALDISKSFQNAFIFIRYIIFSIAISYWLLIEKRNLTFFSLSPDLNNVSENIIVSGQNPDDQISCITKHIAENRTASKTRN